MKTIGKVQAEANSEVYAVASGAIGTDVSCIVNADGTVSVVSGTAESLGSQVAVGTFAFEGTPAAVYDTGQDKVLFIYQGASNYGNAVVGTVSGSSISFGTPSVFISSNTSGISATFDSNAGKTGIFFTDGGNSSYGKALVATISGTSVSFGSTVTHASVDTQGRRDSTFDSSQNKLLLVYPHGSSNANTVAATISGTDIAFGSVEALDDTTNAYELAIQYDSNASKSLVIYSKNGTDDRLYGKVVTLSGTTISLGSEALAVAASSPVPVDCALTYDSTNSKIVMGYAVGSPVLYYFQVGTISGTSFSFGTAVSTGVRLNITTRNHLHYNAAAEKVVIAGRDDGASHVQKYVTATVSGTTISVDSAVTYYASTSYVSCSTYDSDQQKSVLFYAASSFSNPAVKILTVGSTTLTSENYIGISNAAYADTQTATIQAGGAVNTGQSSLTAGQQYFVQEDGTLGLTADSTSVIAGTAVSATNIIVKG